MTGATDTILTAIQTASARLADAGVEDPARDARLLVGHGLGLSRVQLLARERDPLPEGALSKIDVLIDRRAAREPVSRIVGRRGFWTLDLALHPDTLDPRPDSETVIDAVLDFLPDRSASLRVLDLGTGTGCLLLALLSELPNATGVGTDISSSCVFTANENARNNSLADRATFLEGDWTDALEGAFDVIVSNPPYIPSGEIDALMPEVARHDPRRALDGGADGLTFYRTLLADLKRLLAADGICAVEVGSGQAGDVVAIAQSQGLSVLDVRRDLSGIERVIAIGL